MIYIVEDDKAIGKLMAYTLDINGFESQLMETKDQLLEAINRKIPDLIILDIMLPQEDGLFILKDLRKREISKDIAVIIESAKGEEYDRVYGLDLGADDYLAKPFSMLEMVSRVKAVLRRTKKDQDQGEKNLRNGRIKLIPSKHEVYISDKKIDLTLKEYQLLKCFMENKGIVFTRDDLLKLVWGEDYFGETRTVDVHIASLRTKLEDESNLILTIRGLGYKMEEDDD